MVGVRLQRAKIALTDAAAIEALVASLDVRCTVAADAAVDIADCANIETSFPGFAGAAEQIGLELCEAG